MTCQAIEILRALYVNTIQYFDGRDRISLKAYATPRRTDRGFVASGTHLYVKSRRCESPICLNELIELDAPTLSVWNGGDWNPLKSIEISDRLSDGLSILLRSGEQLTCSPGQLLVTKRGIIPAGDICVGDCLCETRIPEPAIPDSPMHLPDDQIGWFVGMYFAEGSGGLDGTIEISGHAKEVDRVSRLKQIAAAYGAKCRVHHKHGNAVSACIDSRVLSSVLSLYLAGRTAREKRMQRSCWKRSNDFLRSFFDGYLEGDGHWDASANRWRLGFTRNYRWAQNIRSICSRLGLQLTLNPGFSRIEAQKFPVFRGEVRASQSQHWNAKDRSEVVFIKRARRQRYYGLRHAIDTNSYCLASGVLLASDST